MSTSASSAQILGCRRVPLEEPACQDNPRLFALQVQDNVMAGKHIIAGDVLIFEHGMEPRAGDIVAAYIDNESVVRSYVSQHGNAFLKAAHPDYPDLIPAQELVIQGVMIKLIRERH